jgi:hypothetical protein
MQIMTLSKFLDCVPILNWRDLVFVPTEGELSEHTIVAILEDDEDEYSQEAKDYILMHRLRYVSSVHTFQGVVSNAKLQRINTNTKELIKAFNFYIKNDAFIDLSMYH